MDTERFDFPSDSPPAQLIVISHTTLRQDMQRVRISFSGEIDLSSSDAVQAAVYDALRSHQPRHLEVDLAEVRFMDSSGIHALLRCRTQAIKARCQLVVTNAQPIVYRVLEISGVVAVLSITPVREQPVEG